MHFINKYLLGLFFLLPLQAYAQTDGFLDIAPFGVLTTWSVENPALGTPVASTDLINTDNPDQEWNVGVLWREPRDVQSIQLIQQTPLSGDVVKKIKIQYWSSSWPDEPPHLPSVEDQEDDPWQGQWLTAQTCCDRKSDTLLFTFLPMTVQENLRTPFLPQAVNYRRTLKVRLVYPFKSPPPKAIKVFSATAIKKTDLLIRLGCQLTASQMIQYDIRIVNGELLKLSPWRWQAQDHFSSTSSFVCETGQGDKGVLVELVTADPMLPGSADHTIVTVQLPNAAFSFYSKDLINGPIRIPAFDADITLAADSANLFTSAIKNGFTVREKLKSEAEQTLARSRAEIPALNPVHRDKRGIGDRLYLPLCAEAHWQKFGLEWGGNFFMNKKYVRAKAKELARCQWPGDTLHWQIGTGARPDFYRTPVNCQMSILNNYLPVVTSRWTHEGLTFEEEAFATLLDAPLAPEGAGRDEQATALLMVRLRIGNPVNKKQTADIWIKSDPLGQLSFKHGAMLQKIQDQQYIRMYIADHGDGAPVVTDLPDDPLHPQVLHFQMPIPANEQRELVLVTPFVSDLQSHMVHRLGELNYENERTRIIDYWRERIAPHVAFTVPEEKFNELARAILIHLYMTVWKEPGSGLYLLPAAALRYQIYANESCFQMMLLDLLGAHKNVAEYLETFITLQGSKPLPGAFVGSQNAVYFGARIDDDHDYTATGYNLHHGTVLWTMARHYLLTRDDSWLRHAAPSMLAAAEWIIAQRKNSAPDYAKGLLPAGRLEDNKEWNYWFSVNAYAWLGLKTTAQAFSLAGMAEAEQLQKEAADYYKDLRQAVESATQYCPVVRLRNNTFVPFVPTAAGRRFRGFDLKSDYYRRYDPSIKPMLRLSATREILYGPMILLNSGVIGAQESLADWILDDWEDNLTLSSSLGLSVHGWVEDERWFSQGGMVFQANLQNPIQAYLLRRETPAALRSLYNNMTACLHPDVNVFTEEYRTWIHGSGPFYKTPDEVRFLNRVCDLLVLENDKQLWLACGTPRRWLEPGHRIELNTVATVFGKVSYQMHAGDGPNTVVAQVKGEFWQQPERLALYVRAPFTKKINRVLLNQKEWNKWNADQEVIFLDAALPQQTVQVFY